MSLVRSVKIMVGSAILAVLLGTLLSRAGVEKLAWSEKDTLTKHISKNQPDMTDEEIAAVLELPRIDDGKFLYVSDDYKTVVMFIFDKVNVTGPLVIVTYTGEVLYDYVKKKR